MLLLMHRAKPRSVARKPPDQRAGGFGRRRSLYQSTQASKAVVVAAKPHFDLTDSAQLASENRCASQRIAEHGWQAVD